MEKCGISNRSARKAKGARQKASDTIKEKEEARDHWTREQFGKLTETMHMEMGGGNNQRKRSEPSATR